jgi:branched-chain amino acid transport system substrate-binding protein
MSKGDAMYLQKFIKFLFILKVCLSLTTHEAAADPKSRVIEIAGLGAKSGPIRSSGINSEAVLLAARDRINAKGIRLADGSRAIFKVTYYDSACNVEKATTSLKKIADTQALAIIGPTCSHEAEAMFGALQKKTADAQDSGIRIPVLVDTAIKPGLARMSEWAFRNVPNEDDMYQQLFVWIKATYPQMKTAAAGFEGDHGHSKGTYLEVIKKHLLKEGYELQSEVQWNMTDTNFTTQVRKTIEKNPDMIIVSAHDTSTCGFLHELAKQNYKPKLLLGLTSSAKTDLLKACGREADGIVIPTSFYPVTPDARLAIETSERYKGSVDLHSAAAWENLEIIKRVIQESTITGKPEDLISDRQKLREGLSKLRSTKGLLGIIKRTQDREAIKPYFFVQAQESEWVVRHNPNRKE